MSVSSLPPITNSNSTTAITQRKTTLTQDDFMNLFVKQLKFPNPLQPLDNNQMATQMDQFNTASALTTMNTRLNQMTSQTSLSNLQASTLIGKKIQAKGNNLAIQNGMVSNGAYQLSQAGNVTIQISDSSGNLVRQINAGYQGTSMQNIGWDGKNQQGTTLPDGTYTFKVLAADQKGQAVTVTTYQLGKVDGVSFENGTAYFQVGGNKINFRNILSILN